MEEVEYSCRERDPEIVAVGGIEAEFGPPRGLSTANETPRGCCGNHTVTDSPALVLSTLATRERASAPPNSPPENTKPAEHKSLGK